MSEINLILVTYQRIYYKALDINLTVICLLGSNLSLYTLYIYTNTPLANPVCGM